MLRLNTAVSREVSAELERQELKPKAVTFWLGVGDRRAWNLCKGSAVWTLEELEACAEGMGVSLSDLLSRVAARL